MNVMDENRYLQQVQSISIASLCDFLPSRLTNIRRGGGGEERLEGGLSVVPDTTSSDRRDKQVIEKWRLKKMILHLERLGFYCK